MSEPKPVTVAIPLHRSWAWRENVLGNIERLRGRASILVSDPQDGDGTLAWLRERLADQGNVAFVGRRGGCEGLSRHANDLLGRIATSLGMFLPHDDEIGPDWISEAEDQLEQAPDAILAVGRMKAIPGPGHLFVGQVHELSPRLQSQTEEMRLEAAGEFLTTSPHELGLAFRGVFRTGEVCRFPEGLTNDEWTDLYWACAMAVKGRFVSLPSAIYRKRFLPHATHLRWNPFDPADAAEVIQCHVLPAAGKAGPEEGHVAAGHLWRGTHRAIAAHRAALLSAHEAAKTAHDRVVEESERLRELLAKQEEQAERRVATLAANAADADSRLSTVYRSRSWRMTAPLRRAMKGVRQAGRR